MVEKDYLSKTMPLKPLIYYIAKIGIGRILLFFYIVAIIQLFLGLWESFKTGYDTPMILGLMLFMFMTMVIMQYLLEFGARRGMMTMARHIDHLYKVVLHNT